MSTNELSSAPAGQYNAALNMPRDTALGRIADMAGDIAGSPSALDLPVTGLPDSAAPNEMSALSLPVDDLPFAPDPKPILGPAVPGYAYRTVNLPDVEWEDMTPEARRIYGSPNVARQELFRFQGTSAQADAEYAILGKMTTTQELALPIPEAEEGIEEKARRAGMTVSAAEYYQANDPKYLESQIAIMDTMRASGSDGYVTKRMQEVEWVERHRASAAFLAQSEAYLRGISGDGMERIAYDLRVGFGQVGAFGMKAAAGGMQALADFATWTGNPDADLTRRTALDWRETAITKQAEWLGPAIDTGNPVTDFLRTSIFQGSPFLAGSVALALTPAGPAGAAGIIAGGMGLETYGDTRAAGVSPLLSAAAAGGTFAASYFLNTFELTRWTNALRGRSPLGVFSFGTAKEVGQELLSEAGESLAQGTLTALAKVIDAPGYTRMDFWRDVADSARGSLDEGVAAGTLAFAMRLAGAPGAVRGQARSYTFNKNFRAMGDTLEKTEIFKKSPAVAAEEINNTARHHGGAGIVFVSIPELEQGGLPSATIIEGLRVNADEYAYAKATNQDLAVPIGNALVFSRQQKAAGNEYFQNLFKADPDAMTGREIIEQSRELDVVLKLAEAEFAAMPEAEKADAMPLRIKTFRAGLLAAGFSQNEADASAAVFLARAKRAAELWGETADEWLDRKDVQLEFDTALSRAGQLRRYQNLIQEQRDLTDYREGRGPAYSPLEDGLSAGEAAVAANEPATAPTAEAAQASLMQPAISEGDNHAWLDEAAGTVMRELGLEGEQFAPLAKEVRKALEQGVADPDVRAMAEQLGLELPVMPETPAEAMEARTEEAAVNEAAQAIPPIEELYRVEADVREVDTADVVEIDPSEMVDDAGNPLDLKNTGALRKWLLGKFDGMSVKIADDGTIQEFTADNLKASLKRRGKKQRQAYARLNSLLEKSVYDGFETADAKHPDIKGQNIYHAAAKIGDGYYGIRFKVDMPLNEGKPSYKDHKVTEIEIAPALYAETTPPAALPEGNPGAIRKVSIPVIKGKVKPSNIADGTLYQPARGSIRPPQYTDAPTIMKLFENRDVSTVMHEINHLCVFDLQEMVAAGKGGPEAARDLAALVAFGSGTLDRTTEAGRAGLEKVATGWERYFMEGRAPKAELLGVFEKMRVWMNRIYSRATQELDVEPTPEVRAVFDRMLATDREIEEARGQGAGVQKWYDILGTVEAEDRRRIELAQARATAKTRSKMDRRRAGRAFRGLGDLNEIRRIIKGETENVPVYHALDEVREAGGMDREAVEMAVGESGAAEIARRHGENVYTSSVSEGEADIDMTAAKNGFRDAEDMLSFMADSPPIETAVQLRVEEELNRRDRADETREENEGGLAADDGDAAQTEAIMEELTVAVKEQAKRDKNIHLGRALREYQVKRAAMQAAVERFIGAKREREAVDVRVYQRAERQARKAALEAAAKGDLAEVVKQKEMELLHHLEVSEAMRARELRNKIVKEYSTKALLKSLQADKYHPKVEDAYAEAIKQVAEFMGFTSSRQLKPATESETLILPSPEAGSNVADFVPDLTSTLEPWMAAKIRPEGYQSFQDFTFNQLKEADRVMQMLLNQGRGVLTAMRDLGVKNIDDLAIKSMQPMTRRESRPAVGTDDRTRWGKILDKVNRYLISITIPENWFMAMDGNPTIQGKESGINQQMFWKLRDCQVKKDALYKGLMEKLTPNFTQLTNAKNELERRFGGTRFTIPGLPVPEILKTKRNWPTWDADMLLAVALNMGNDANLYALAEGYGFTQAQLDVIGSLFSADAWKAIQGVWDSIDSLYPQLDVITFRITNRHMTKETAQGFTVMTSDGQMLQMKGGYFPLVYDPMLSERAGQISDIENAIQAGVMYNVTQSANLAPGMLQERMRDENGKPLVGRPQLLRTNLIIRHLDAATHYISHAETILEFDRLTRHPTWRAMYVDKFGEQQYRAIRNWAQDLARPNRMNNSAGAEFMEKMRTLATVNALGLRGKTGLKQREGLFNAASFMKGNSRTGVSGWKYMVRGIREIGWGGNFGAKTERMRWVDSVSGYMSARDGSHDRELRAQAEKLSPLTDDIRIPLTERKVSRKDIHNAMFWWIQANDRAAAYAVWIGAYEQAMAGDANFSLDANPGETTDQQNARLHDMAVQYADAAAATQASSFQADLTELQKDQGILRFLSMFMSGNVRQGSRLMQYIDAYRMGDKTKLDIASVALREFVFPSLAWVTLGAIAKYALGDDEDDLFTDAAWEVAETAIAPFPLLRDMTSIVKYGPLDVPAVKGPSRAVQQTYKAFGKAWEGEYMKAAANFASGIGFFTGVPVMNPIREMRPLGEAAGLVEPSKRK